MGGGATVPGECSGTRVPISVLDGEHTPFNSILRKLYGYGSQDTRHACNHPYIKGTRPKEVEMGHLDANGKVVKPTHIIDCCGKMQVLHQLLERLGKEGHKTLVFSQFTTVLDLIGESLKLKG